MISGKKLIILARKWQKHASIKQKKITLLRMSLDLDENDCYTSSIIKKGHFVAYNADHKLFMLPLEYLNKEIVRELFKLAEEEFGIPSNGPLTLPYDAVLLQYVISLIKQRLTEDAKKALLKSIASGSHHLHTYTKNQEIKHH